MIVAKLFCVSLCARCVAELNLGFLLSGFNHIGFMAERVSEYVAATLVNKVKSCVKAGFVFADTGLDDNLLVA